MIVKNFVRIVLTVFESFEIFIQRSGEKRYDFIGSPTFFPTPENENRPTDQ